MAKTKPVNRFIEIVEENEIRQQQRADKIAKLEESYQSALTELSKAESVYEDAKKNLDAKATIKAKSEIAAAEEVVEMFKSGLDAAKREGAFSQAEINKAVHDIYSYATTVNDAASVEVCKLLVQIEPFITDTESILESCNSLIKEISRNSPEYSDSRLNTLLTNVRNEISHSKQHFGQYFPDK